MDIGIHSLILILIKIFLYQIIMNKKTNKDLKKF